MKTTALLLLGVAMLVCAAGGLAESSDPVVQELTQLNAQLQLDTKNYDTADLAKLITQDFHLISSSGKVYDRRAFLADAADRSAVYLANEPEDVSVQDYNGDAAVVSAILHVRYSIAGKVRDVRVRYGDTWVKQNGEWRYAYGEASPMLSK
jgi:hypothetical protein